MIVGKVNEFYEALVALRLRGPTGVEAVVQAIVDTGSTASLTLPSNVIQKLELFRKAEGPIQLADGRLVQIEYYEAELQWLEGWRTIYVTAVGDEILLGMGMLEGNSLYAEIVDGGSVRISALPQII